MRVRNSLRDNRFVHLLHVVIFEQAAALEAFLDLGKSRVLDILFDSTGELFETVAFVGDQNVDALRSSFVEDPSDGRHLGFGSRGGCE
jgi:hypothetical protein